MFLRFLKIQTSLLLRSFLRRSSSYEGQGGATKDARKVGIRIGIVIFTLFLSITVVRAQVMSSPHYSIESDSVNFGGVRSTSSSYTVEDTLGEVATGVSSSTNYTVNAGYQQMHEIYLSVTAAASVVMSPNIDGVIGGTSNGSTTFTVTTDNPAGYSATIQASSSPALTSGTDSFADYVPASVADYTFTNAPTASSFAFTTKGADVVTAYKDDGANCNVPLGSSTSGRCWDGISTSAKQIFLNRNSSNHSVGGTATTLEFRAASGSSHVQTNGLYVATSTITVIPL